MEKCGKDVQCLTATYRVPPNPWWSSSGRPTVRLLGAGGSVGELENWRTGEVWDRFDIRKTHQWLISKGDDLLEKKDLLKVSTTRPVLKMRIGDAWPRCDSWTWGLDADAFARWLNCSRRGLHTRGSKRIPLTQRLLILLTSAS